MKKKFLAKVAICFFSFAAVGYEHIHEINKMTSVRIQIPKIQQEIHVINEEIDQLNYEFQEFENPQRLLHLAKQAEYSDLHFPYQQDILVMQHEIEQQTNILVKHEAPFKINTFKLSVILGAH